MYNTHIVGITKSGELNNLKELLQPLYAFYDSLQWTFNLPTDEGYDYLESIKKDGIIIKNEFNYRLDDCRNRFLFNGNMKSGDFMFIVDDKERLLPQFFQIWPQFKQFLINNDIDGIVLYGKRFLYRYSEFLRFSGNPHEGLYGANKVVELTSIDQFKDTSWFWGSVRNQQRDKFEFVFHYLFYYTFPSSNHCLLGNEGHPEIYQKEEFVRRQFRLYLEQNNLLPITKDKFIWLCKYKLSDIKDWLNESKVLNDAYRNLVLDRTDFEDNHDFNNKIVI